MTHSLEGCCSIQLSYGLMNAFPRHLQTTRQRQEPAMLAELTADPKRLSVRTPHNISCAQALSSRLTLTGCGVRIS